MSLCGTAAHAAVLLAGVGLGIALVAVEAVAQNQIRACVKPGTGTVRIVGPTEQCKAGETLTVWGITGPQGPQGPQGAAGPAGTSDIFFNRNFQNVPLAPFPGVTVATLSLPPGSYVISAKFRYRNTGSEIHAASCVYQGAGIGGLDSSQNTVEPGGASSQIDGYMMDILIKNPDDDPDVHVQCFGPPDVQIINTQFGAVLTTNLEIQ
jgi:hypothetical protein